MRSDLSRFFKIPALVLLALRLTSAAFAQSTDPNYPTPIETNEINGAIKARDIGDSRSTSYFYTFDGGQGDIFINVVTKNFAGDIDVFAADRLRPLTKMVIYPDDQATETGRLIYLRKGERLVLRVEGRSPDDDAAEFRIKFGGSFIAITGQKIEEAPTVAGSESASDTGVKVNTVGTIVAVVPKPTPVKTDPPEEKEGIAEKEPEPVSPQPIAPEPAAEQPAEKPVAETPPTKKVVVVSDFPTVFGKKPPKGNKAKPPARSKKAAAEKAIAEKAIVEKPPVVPTPDPLASIRLVVELKDGNVIERPMSEVVKFSVDKGILTVTEKGGKVTRYSMILDVSKVTIQ